MIIPEGYYQVNLIFTGDDVPNGAQCTFGLFDAGFDGSPLDVASAVETIFDGAAPLLAATMPHTKISTIHVKAGPNDDGPFADKAVDIAGTSTTTESIPNCAYLIHKQTTHGGRKGRGRLFWPGACMSEVDKAGILGNDTFIGINTGFESIVEDLNTAQLTPMLLHSAGVTLPYEITAMTCDAKIATQRRRLRR